MVSFIQHSATYQQILCRIELIQTFQKVWEMGVQHWPNHPQTRRSKVHLLNMFLLIIFDSLAGLVLMAVIFYYGPFVVNCFERVGDYFTNSIIVANIRWLMGWPAGFKLNDNVDSFMGQLFLFYNRVWIQVLLLLPIAYRGFVVLLACSGVLGVSLMLSIVSDFIYVYTLHVTFFYTASARIYMHQLQAMSALWKLFRGKKRNVLRNRIDSCHFDIDQLLLGTILFTVLFFLFPTIAIYYLYFSMVRLVVFACYVFIYSALQILNHFPIYGILLYIIDSSLFPGMFCFWKFA